MVSHNFDQLPSLACGITPTFFLDLLQQSVLIEGVLFRARYLGSTQLVCEGQPTKTTRMMQAEEAVSRIKVMHEFVSNPSGCTSTLLCLYIFLMLHQSPAVLCEKFADINSMLS